MGLNGKRFSAIEGGWRGCAASHITLLDQHKNEEQLCILEDDCLFIEDINPYMYQSIEQLPTDWDMLMLGGSPRKPQVKYSENLFCANGVYTSHAILWHTRKGGAVEYILSHKKDVQKWDVYLATVIQPLFNCYMTDPLICTQKEGFQSDTCRRADVSTIQKNFNAFCK